MVEAIYEAEVAAGREFKQLKGFVDVSTFTPFKHCSLTESI